MTDRGLLIAGGILTLVFGSALVYYLWVNGYAGPFGGPATTAIPPANSPNPNTPSTLGYWTGGATYLSTTSPQSESMWNALKAQANVGNPTPTIGG